MDRGKKKKEEEEEEETPKRDGGDPFEFCDVCRLNHDQRPRPPPPLLPLSHVREPGDSVPCCNAINHLASSEHLRNLKGFLRKHGGGVDRIDSFRVSDEELAEWEKACKSLKSAASTSGQGTIGPFSVPLKDIQHEHTSNNMNSFDKHSITSSNSNAYHPVMPLQTLTNESHRLYPQDLSGATGAGSVPYETAAFSVDLQGNTGSARCKQPMQLVNNVKILGGYSLINRTEDQTAPGGSCNGALQKVTQISCAAKGSQQNVHSGALPPWLDANEEKDIGQLNTGQYLNNLTQTGKLKKLNPKRVGAAWAERRRIELEMEKRGERLLNTFDANWLPNFGRVWQAGTRKESKREFETEKRKSIVDDNQPELPFKAQPYISKRARTGSPNRQNADSGCVDDIANNV
ncbi:uncharacterized protein A4U43_C10F4830 [Asparagus officinalis]|uniref:TITAN-like protein n=1 Tax=Asparagus officinalis TaxID=4686 RepID=A0A5P1E3U6_ASPOF|nr:uncharacterized protein A4U43_C10F4830 [Asparagus officinalis]